MHFLMLLVKGMFINYIYYKLDVNSIRTGFCPLLKKSSYNPYLKSRSDMISTPKTNMDPDPIKSPKNL